MRPEDLKVLNSEKLQLGTCHLTTRKVQLSLDGCLERDTNSTADPGFYVGVEGRQHSILPKFPKKTLHGMENILDRRAPPDLSVQLPSPRLSFALELLMD